MFFTAAVLATLTALLALYVGERGAASRCRVLAFLFAFARP
jgi:hypothetical protein